eukprot:Opistho-2@25974
MFVRVDHDYVVNAAKIAKEEGTRHFGLVSSSGADPKSWFLYLNTKGRTEEDVKALSFPSLAIYQPGFLECNRAERRPMERAALAFIPSFGRVFAPNKMSVRVETVARAMRLFATTAGTGDAKPVSVLSNKDIVTIAGGDAPRTTE